MSISVYQSVANRYDHLRAIHTVSMMNTISHQLEDQVVRHRLPVDFYAGFQHFSRFPPQLRRYSQLALVCRRVYVFGVPDVRPPLIQNVEFIEIDPASPLAQEWFLLVDTPDFWTLLSTQEQAEGRDVLSGGRAFHGVWSFDPQVVEHASRLLAPFVGNRLPPASQRNHERQNLHIAEINGRMIEMLEQSRVSTQRRWKQISTLHKVTEALVKRPELTALFSDAARTLTGVMGASGAAIALLDQGNHYTLIAGEGDSSASGTPLQVGDGPSGRAMAQASLVHVRDGRRSYERDPLLPVSTNVMAAPLVGKRGVYGVVAVGDSDPNRWNDDDGKTLLAVAALLAAAAETRLGAGDGSADRAEENEFLRGSLAYMMMLHQRLRLEGSLSETQRQLLDRVMNLSMALAQTVGLPDSMVASINAGD